MTTIEEQQKELEGKLQTLKAQMIKSENEMKIARATMEKATESNEYDEAKAKFDQAEKAFILTRNNANAIEQQLAQIAKQKAINDYYERVAELREWAKEISDLNEKAKKAFAEYREAIAESHSIHVTWNSAVKQLHETAERLFIDDSWDEENGAPYYGRTPILYSTNLTEHLKDWQQRA